MTRPRLAAVVIAVVLGAAGCSSGDAVVVEGLTVEQAKSMTMAADREIVAALDPGSVGEVLQRGSGSLLSCSRGSHRWAGGTDFFIADGADMEEVLESVGSTYSERDDFSVEWDEDRDHDARLRIEGRDGLTFLLSQWPQEGFIGVLSFSPCFELPEGTYPGGDW